MKKELTKAGERIKQGGWKRDTLTLESVIEWGKEGVT